MISFFEKILEWDRPFAEARLPDGSKAFARRMSAAQQDELEAFYADEYARQVVKLTEEIEGKQSELERTREVFRGRTREETLDRILNTRLQDINQRALAFMEPDYPLAQRNAEMEALKDKPEELESYQKTIVDLYTPYRERAVASVREEYDDKSLEDLIDLAAQITINMIALQKAGEKRGVRKLYYTLYDENKQCVFESPKQVEEFQPDTLNRLLQAVEYAFLTKSEDTDLPFESPAVPEHDGQPPSQSASVVDSTDGGQPTTLP